MHTSITLICTDSRYIHIAMVQVSYLQLDVQLMRFTQPWTFIPLVVYIANTSTYALYVALLF